MKGHGKGWKGKGRSKGKEAKGKEGICTHIYKEKSAPVSVQVIYPPVT